jgi:tape measure domain-containing protein
MSRMSLETAIRLSAEVKGSANITKIQRSLQDLAKGSQTTARDMDALRTATAQYARASEGSIAGLRNSITAFRGLQEQARIGGREFRRYGDELARLESRLKSLDQTSNRTALVAGLAGGVAGAIAVQAANVAGQGARGIVSVGLDAESARVRLRALSNEFGEYNKAQAASARIAQTLRLSTIEAEDAFAGLYASLRPTGVTVEEIEKAFIGFTAAARNSGATAQESAAAMIQLRQALSSGILQGEELRSIREQAPLVAQAIAQEMGVTIGKLKELGAEGKITTDVVLRSLARLNETQLDKLNEQFNTGRQAIKDFQVEASVLGTEIARIFGPSAVSLLRTFTGALRDAANVMGSLTGNAQSLENIKIEQRASDQAGAEANQKFGLFTFDQGGKSSFFQNRRRQIMQQMQRERASVLPASEQLTPAQIAAQQAAVNQRAQQAAAAAAGGGGGGGARQQSAEDRIAAMPFGREIIAAAKANSIDPALFAALVAQESGFNPTARGRRRDGSFSGAFGLAQLKPDTARDLGVNPRDPMQNLMGGAKYLRQQMDRFGLEGGLRAYNQGPGAQQRTPGGNSQESREYPGKVLAQYQRFAGSGEGLAGLRAEGVQSQAEAVKAMQDQQKAAAELLATEDNRLKLLQIADPLQKQIAESVIKQLTIQDEYGKRLAESKSAEERRSLELAQQNALQSNTLELESSINDLREDSLKPLRDIVREHGDRLAYEREYGGLLATGINPELAKQFMEIDRIAQASKISLETQIARLEVMAAELPVDDKLRKSLEDQVKLKRELLGLVPEGAAEAKDDATETARVVTDREKQQADAEARAERLKDLYKSIGSTLEEGLIGAIQTGIDGLIDGTQRLDESLKEILSGVLRDIANQLLRFAVNTALKSTGLPIFADGGVFGGGSITPFANGGVVNEPTMFKFSQGGAMQNGLLGEAGPEAILPLRRGPDGRLGVDASGMAVPFQATPAAAPNDLAVPFMRSGNSSPAAMAAEAARAMASTPLEPIKLQVESRVINGVEYVTTSQLREATEAAAMAGRDSAYEGMRNNPSIQRSLGMR